MSSDPAGTDGVVGLRFFRGVDGGLALRTSRSGADVDGLVDLHATISATKYLRPRELAPPSLPVHPDRYLTVECRVGQVLGSTLVDHLDVTPNGIYDAMPTSEVDLTVWVEGGPYHAWRAESIDVLRFLDTARVEYHSMVGLSVFVGTALTRPLADRVRHVFAAMVHAASQGAVTDGD